MVFLFTLSASFALYMYCRSPSWGRHLIRDVALRYILRASPACIRPYVVVVRNIIQNSGRY
ncbi:hypothetical protein M758_UG170100 [Ceratodon purpureus]|nr:hypothetical protein M758_UG170100 [Ceratodon purpureus]